MKLLSILMIITFLYACSSSKGINIQPSDEQITFAPNSAFKKQWKRSRDIEIYYKSEAKNLTHYNVKLNYFGKTISILAKEQPTILEVDKASIIKIKINNNNQEIICFLNPYHLSTEFYERFQSYAKKTGTVFLNKEIKDTNKYYKEYIYIDGNFRKYTFYMHLERYLEISDDSKLEKIFCTTTGYGNRVTLIQIMDAIVIELRKGKQL